MSRKFTPDELLIDHMMLNDTEAFEELHHRYCYSLYTYCLNKLNSQEDAQQIVRDIFVRLWESRHSLPVDFSVSLHFYNAVRRDVVNCLNEKCNTKSDLSNVEGQIIPGFAAIKLQEARRPVKAAVIHYQKKKNIEQSWWNHYPNTRPLEKMRLALNRVLHLF